MPFKDHYILTLVPFYFPKCTLSFTLFAQAVNAPNTFIAAVYEHAVILPNKTKTPVSMEKALFLMNKNIDILEKTIKLTAKQVSQFCSCLGWYTDLQLDKNVGI